MTLLNPDSIRDPSLDAFDDCAARLHSLPLAPVLTHLVDAVGEDVLPHLAERFHVLHTVAWKRAASPAVKRGLITSAMRRHRIKGTLEGLRLGARDAGCRIISAVTPPDAVYLSPALTVAERNDFVARYPQLRIYRYRTIGTQAGMLTGDCLGEPGEGWRWGFPVVSDAMLRFFPRAYMVKGATSTALTVAERTITTTDHTAESTTVTEVAIPGQGSRLSFCVAWPRHLTVTTAPRRFYRATVTTTYRERDETVRRIALSPGLSPLSIKPDGVAEEGTEAGIFAGRFVHGHFQISTARDRIYQRFYLFDPTIDVAMRTVHQHLNACRLGMPRHHARVTVSVPEKRFPGEAWQFVQGHAVTRPKDRLNDMLEAMRDMARGSDRIAIGFAARRVREAGDSLVAGTHIFGDYSDNT